MKITNANRKIKDIDGKLYIFDNLRKKFLLLTPEEIVRQNFLDFLIVEKKYSKNLIKLESGLKYNDLNKRTDILVYDKMGKPFLLVECKAETVAITQKTIEQVSRYNLITKALHLCVTNGLKTYCFTMDFESNTSKQIKEIPELI